MEARAGDKQLVKQWIELTLYSIIILTSFTVQAEIPRESCARLAVVADTNWAPYSFQAGDSVRGASVELIKKIYSELDIPVKVYPFTSKRRVRHALQLGDVDVLISLYDYPEAHEYVDVIQPGFAEDAISVIVSKTRANTIETWHDLIGMRGIATENFEFDKSFDDFRRQYLYVHKRGDLSEALTDLTKRKIDYIIGSRQQLNFALEQLSLTDNIVLLDKVQHPARVHMGYSRTSPCRHYQPFLKQRLQELAEDGTIDQYVTSYLNDVDFEAQN